MKHILLGRLCIFHSKFLDNYIYKNPSEYMHFDSKFSKILC